MKKELLFLLVLPSVLLLFFSVFVSAVIVSLQPNAANGKDSYIQRDVPTQVRGSASNLDVGPYFRGRVKRSLLEFDISRFPSGKIIHNASLVLFMYNHGAGGTVNISLHRVNQSWREGGLSNGANWNTFNGTPISGNWAVRGGDFVRRPESSTLVRPQGRFYRWDVTDLVNNWYNGSYDNNGMLLRSTNEVADLNLRKRFRSSDWSTASQRPRLVINYSNADQVPPQIEYASGVLADNVSVNNDYVFVNVSVNESNEDTIIFRLFNSSGFLIREDSFTNQTRIVNWSGLADGSYTYNVSVNDTSGNENATSDRSVTLDNSVPQINFTIPTAVSGVKTDKNYVFVNVTVNESNEDTITFSLYNLTGLFNQSLFTDQTRTINWSLLPDGFYSYNVSVNDTSGNSNVTQTRTITLDNSVPQISFGLNTLANGSIANQDFLFVNVTVNESNEDTIMFSLYNVSGLVVQHVFDDSSRHFNFTNLSQGTYWYNVSVLDIANNSNATPTFQATLDAVAPSVSLLHPQPKVYGFNSSLPLNTSIFEPHLDSCWYNVNNSANTTVAGCLNTSFDALGEGSQTLFFFANDSAGNLAKANVSFSVTTTAPALNLITPLTASFLSNASVLFNYSVISGIGVDTCQLVTNQSGSWLVNQTNDSVTVENNQFVLAMVDGAYDVGIWCNDTQGRSSESNASFTVDSTNPSVTISEPSGTKTSRSLIPLVYNVSEVNSDQCWFNVYRGLSVEVGNTSLNCSATSASFNVTVDADFTINIYVNDSASNLQKQSGSFTVSTTGGTNPPGGSGGGSSGGGSGGGSANLASKRPVLEIENITAILAPQEQKSLVATVRNTGDTSANRCRLVPAASFEDVVESADLSNIGVGEIIDFGFILDNSKKSLEEFSMSVECLDNVSMVLPLKIISLQSDLQVEIAGIRFTQGSSIELDYAIGSKHALSKEFLFKLTDAASEPIDSVSRLVEVPAEQTLQETVELSLADADEGVLRVVIADASDNSFVEERIIYDGTPGITGFALADFAGRYSSMGIILLIFLVILFFLVRRMWRVKHSYARPRKSIHRHLSRTHHKKSLKKKR